MTRRTHKKTSRNSNASLHRHLAAGLHAVTHSSAFAQGRVLPAGGVVPFAGDGAGEPAGGPSCGLNVHSAMRSAATAAESAATASARRVSSDESAAANGFHALYTSNGTAVGCAHATSARRNASAVVYRRKTRSM